MADRPESCALKQKVCLSGIVVTGFGRGSKELGIPTANLDKAAIASLSLLNGIYYGWAMLHEQVYAMVMSIGWNPFYKNEFKSAEVHILHEFDNDFYGENLKVVILGYIRPERSYDSKEALISDIRRDIEYAKQTLAQSDQVADCRLLASF